MQQHTKDASVAILDDIREGRIFNPNWLKRRFNAEIPKAAFHTSPELTQFCESIDYTKSGLEDVFNLNAAGLSHCIETVYKKGELDYLYFAKLSHEKVGDFRPFKMSQKVFTVPGLPPYYGRWHDIFKWYGDYIRPVFGNEFQLRMVSRSEPELRFHTDHLRYDKVACTPLGEQQRSTVIMTEDGEMIEPPISSTVITKRGCLHSSPDSKDMRVIISAQPIERDPFTGMVLGFGH